MCTLILVGCCPMVLYEDCTSLYSHQPYMWMPFPWPLWWHCVFTKFCLWQFGKWKMVSQYSFNMLFPCRECSRSSFHMFRTFYLLPCELFISFTHFSIGLLVFSLLICRRSLYIMGNLAFLSKYWFVTGRFIIIIVLKFLYSSILYRYSQLLLQSAFYTNTATVYGFRKSLGAPGWLSQ